MENLLKKQKFVISDTYESPFMNKVGVYQDGTVPMCRDKNGKLWAISGHSHMGFIGMFCGNDLDDMKLAYPLSYNFCVGNAEYAFDKIRYPEGIKARGSIWPFGLYICPVTNRFFAFFHNESGWNGKGTAYDALGLCETPHYDSDFRHVGLMHSDDEGKTWTFDRWVLTAEHVCFTENYNPNGDIALGQKNGLVGLGSGDFSMYIEEDGEYIYLIYDIIHVDTIKGCWKSCDAYIARTRKRTDGVMGDFVKYYNGSFCEAGNFGKETPIIKNAWHARMAYSKSLKCFIMCSSPVLPDSSTGMVADYMELRTSLNMIDWSEPITVKKDGKNFGNHYQAVISYHGKGATNILDGEKFTVMSCHNGTDVLLNDFTFVSDNKE